MQSMKKWSKYLLNIWTPVAILVALNLCIWASDHVDLNPCGYHDAAILGHKQDRFEVVLLRSFCDRGCAEKIVLRKGLLDASVFIYEPIERCQNPS